MRVTVRLFARLREIAGAGELTVDVPERADVRTVWQAVVHRYPAMAPYASSLSSAVNADYTPMGAPVAEGDEVAFLPPVSGG
jgi:molybdopterin converting factor subunit 1